MAWIMTWGLREFLVFTLGGILLVILATVVIYAATGNL
jgi:hypothetical protein